MARFKREKKLYKLSFETPDLEGFECYVHGMTLARFMELTAVAEEFSTPEGRTEENIRRQYQIFAQYLESWNLDDEADRPVPCTYEGLADQDFDFVQAIMKAWMQAIAGVPDDLGKDSGSGETSQAESRLRLADLSENLAS